METLDTDVLIVGAGPGGLQLAERLRHANVRTLVLDAADRPGGFFRRFPRHRRLISVNKSNVDERVDNPMRFDWNSLLTEDPRLRFPRYSSDYFPDAEDLLSYLADFAAELPVRYDTRVLGIEELPDHYRVTVEKGPPLTARRVVIATGMAPHVAAIPGIEHAERYDTYHTDPDGFRGARVLIIGKGNSGFEIADSLMPTAATVHLVSPHPVRMAWNTHYVGHVRAVNNEAVDGYQLKLGAALLDAEVTGIRRDESGYHVDLAYTHADGHRVTYRYDRVIAATGFRFDPAPLASLDPPLRHRGKFPAMTADYRFPTSAGLYFAGTLTHARDYRKTSSGFIHGFRYNAAFLAKVLAYGQPPPDAKLAPEAEALSVSVLRRINRSDALYLQPGYLADVYVANGVLAHHAAVPLDWVREGGAGQGWRAAVTLEYGPPAPDPLRVDRSPDPSYAKVTPFLHPVVRILRGDEEIDRLDLLEDLENRYAADEHLPALRSFFQSALADATLDESVPHHATPNHAAPHHAAPDDKR